MNWLDVSILVVIAISVLISVFQGFAREALSLAAWILAIIVARTFATDLGVLFESQIETELIRYIVGFAILFIITLFLGGLVNYLVRQIIKKTGLSGTDRMLGVFFGFARGVLIIAVLVFMGGLSTLPQEKWWQGALLMPYFEDLVLWVSPFLPPELAEGLNF